ncbi:hypothetical protein B0J11DRAFT_454636 [Dendryphion nanum]|uniref:Uncharacterized protein n=1 Tax=Dendryphion nanum TaxID=256645 RepID=A0A9P9EEZ7_9PLEO|nr:hypothetical protein B0J11DRAFT_454636 [Dendryphion nanum]
MAPRRRVIVSSDDYDSSFDPESSPDPLHASINDNKHISRAKSTRTSKGPLTSSSPNKQNRRSSINEHTAGMLSPSKSMVMHTPRAGGVSPWRIKVTVQAEPGSGLEDESLESPIVSRMTRTTTTTIPLKGGDDGSPVKRRGRPRKSDAGMNTEPKRSGTPIRKRSTSKVRSSSVGPFDANNIGTPAGAPPKKKRGRPRKSIQPAEEEDIVLSALTEPSLETLSPMISAEEEPLDVELFNPSVLDPVSNAASNKRRGRPRKTPSRSVTPQTQPTTNLALGVSKPTVPIPTIDSTLTTLRDASTGPDLASIAKPSSHLRPQSKGRKPLYDDQEYEERMASTPPQTDLSRRLQGRRGTPHAKVVALPEDFSDDSNEGSEAITPPETDEEANNQAQQADSAHHTHSSEYPFKQATIMDVGIEDEDHVHDVDQFAFDEGTTRMPDDTTLLESEHFSIISVDSLPSGRSLICPTSVHVGGKSNARALYPALSENPSDGANSQLDHVDAGSRPSLSVNEPSSRGIDTRHRTPMMDDRSPSNPPAIVPGMHSPSEVETPKIGRVVKAGAALQDVLDPDRITPNVRTSSLGTRDSEDRMEDLFRGFSEKTRRQLQDGFRLGEQLAMEDDHDLGTHRSSPALSSPIKPSTHKEPTDKPFSGKEKRKNPRLPTPEDQDKTQEDYNLTIPSAVGTTQVYYPSLNLEDQNSHLATPDMSGDEMSWRVDTPPVKTNTNDTSCMMTAVNERGEELRGTEIHVVADDEAGGEQGSDIWEEEAHRDLHRQKLKDLSGTTKNTPQLQDLFTGDGLNKPARRKLPKTWRRKSSNDFSYSDELEEPTHALGNSGVVRGAKNMLLSPPPSEEPESGSSKPTKVNREALEPQIPEEQNGEYDEGSGDESDDTGMFFHTNLPSVFNKKKSAAKKVHNGRSDLSILLGGEDDFIPDSSPPVPKASTKSNPFNNTPPRFPALPASMVKNSPLRNEIRASDSEESSMHATHVEESSLPMSSPFHTNVDNTMFSTASDQRQLHEGVDYASTDSSIRRLREEADDRAYAYGSHHHSINEIEEVTEPSTNLRSLVITPSPSCLGIETSMLKPKRARSPLFGGVDDAPTSLHAQQRPHPQTESKPVQTAPVTVPILEVTPSPQPGGFFSKIASIWGGRDVASAPSLHPLAVDFDYLPKMEPWTKTHYKTLDALFQLHKNDSSLFAISSWSENAETNAKILQEFLSKNRLPFVGAQYDCWGYSFVMDESLVVICGVYMQLLTLNNIEEYKAKSGKNIEIGDCGPGEPDTEIDGEKVVERLATIVIGEHVRKDEKKGMKIRRRGMLRVDWGQMI